MKNEKKAYSAWSASLAAPLIKDYEGRKLVAYKCPAGIWTIGNGHTGPEVHEGLTITDAQADEWLMSDILKVVRGLARYINVPVTEGQFIALTSLAFNIGVSKLVHECPKLMRAVNAGDVELAAEEFLDINRAGGVVLPGLVRRRKAESDLYLNDVS